MKHVDDYFGAGRCMNFNTRELYERTLPSETFIRSLDFIVSYLYNGV